MVGVPGLPAVAGLVYAVSRGRRSEGGEPAGVLSAGDAGGAATGCAARARSGPRGGTRRVVWAEEGAAEDELEALKAPPVRGGGGKRGVAVGKEATAVWTVPGWSELRATDEAAFCRGTDAVRVPIPIQGAWRKVRATLSAQLDASSLLYGAYVLCFTIAADDEAGRTEFGGVVPDGVVLRLHVGAFDAEDEGERESFIQAAVLMLRLVADLLQTLPLMDSCAMLQDVHALVRLTKPFAGIGMLLLRGGMLWMCHPEAVDAAAAASSDPDAPMDLEFEGEVDDDDDDDGLPNDDSFEDLDDLGLGDEDFDLDDVDGESTPEGMSPFGSLRAGGGVAGVLLSERQLGADGLGSLGADEDDEFAIESGPDGVGRGALGGVIAALSALDWPGAVRLETRDAAPEPCPWIKPGPAPPLHAWAGPDLSDMPDFAAPRCTLAANEIS